MANPLREQLEASRNQTTEGRVNPLRQQLTEAQAPAPVQEDPTVTQRVGHIAGGINKGLLDIASLPSNLVNAALSLAGAPESMRLYTAHDIPGAERVTAETVNPETEVFTDALRTGGEWGSGVFVAPSKANTLASGLSAVGAMAGEQLGGDTGELIGGVTGGFTPAGVKQTVKAGSRLLDKFRKTPDVPADTQAAIDFLRHNMGDEAQVTRAIEDALARGEKGSLSDLSRDPRLAAVEREAMRDPTIRESLAPVHRSRTDQLSQQFTDIAPGTGVDPTVAASRRLNKTLTAIDEAQAGKTARTEAIAESDISQSQHRAKMADMQAETAEMRATEADRALGGTGRTDIASTELSQAYDSLDEFLTANKEKPAWKAFEESGDVYVSKMRGEVNELLKGLPQGERIDLMKKYKAVFGHINDLGRVAQPTDVQYVLSAIKDINRSAKNTGEYGILNKRLSEITSIMDNRLRQDPTQVGENFREAISATVEKKQRLASDYLGKARLNEPELFASSAGFKGDKGAATMRNIVESDDPQIMARAEEFVRESIRKEGLTEKTMMNYAPALDYFPDLKRQLNTAIATKADAAAAAADAKNIGAAESKIQAEANSLLKQKMAEIKATSQGRKSTVKGLGLAKYAGSPKKFIKGELSAADDSGELGNIYRRLQKESPEAAAEFKSQSFNELRETALGVNDLNSKDAEKLMASLERLQNNGLIDNADIKQVTDIISAHEGRRLRLAGGSTHTPAALSETVDDMVSTAATLPVLSVLPSSHQLMAAGMLKRNIKRLLRDRHTDPNIVRELNRMLKSPELFLSGLEGKITKTSTPKQMDDAIFAALKTLAISADSE